MIQQSKFEELYGRCGGVYKTTVLMQKRMRELNRGARKLVETNVKSPIAIVMSEIEGKKIEMIPDTEENREVIRAEIERMTQGHAATLELDEGQKDTDIERRILTVLKKGTTEKDSTE